MRKEKFNPYALEDTGAKLLNFLAPREKDARGAAAESVAITVICDGGGESPSPEIEFLGVSFRFVCG